MADYQKISVAEVTDPEEVGVSIGDAAEEGKPEDLRICVSLPRNKRINKDLHEDWDDINWISLTPDVAYELFTLLNSLVESGFIYDKINPEKERDLFKKNHGRTPEAWLYEWRSGKIAKTQESFHIYYDALLLKKIV